MKDHWQTAKLNDVMRFYADHFTPQGRQHILKSEWYLDQSKGEVVFHIYFDEPDKPKGK